MCGRFGLTRSPRRLVELLGGRYEGDFKPRYNIAPTQPVPALLNIPHDAVREIRWGYVPVNAPSLSSVTISTFNARVERVAEAPLYRDALRSRRCVVFADGYYEWRKNGDGSKTPFWLHRPDGNPFAFAGLWSRWHPPHGSATGEVLSCTILAQPATGITATIHDRMPVILDVDAARNWLSSDEHDARVLLDTARGASDQPWDATPVSARVGKVENDDPGLIERVVDPRIPLF